MKYKGFIGTFILGIAFFAMPFHSFAQYTSNLGTFSVTQIKGCAPLELTISSNDPACPCDGTCGCDVWPDFGNEPGSFEQNKLDLTYTESGVYQIQVQVGQLDYDVIEIEVLENILPEFDLSTCTDQQVDVDITDTNYDTYQIDYNDGTVITVNKGAAIPTYRYTSAGTKTINVTGINLNADNSNCNHSSNNKTVEILPTLQNATINSIRLTGKSMAEFNYSGTSFTPYHLQIAFNGDTGFQRYLEDDIAPDAGSISINDSNLDFEKNYYCFRIGTYDKCTNSYTGYSNTVCTIDFNNVQVENNQLNLDWVISKTGVVNFDISRKNDEGINPNYFSVQTLKYEDLNTDCNEEYCYIITACYNNDCTISSTSLERCATAISTDTPTNISDIHANVAGSSLEVSWETPPVDEFIPIEYYVYTDGSAVFTTLTENSFTEAEGGQHCYQISYKDECLNQSEISNDVCSILLTHTNSNGVIKLKWNNYEGWQAGVQEYLIQVTGTGLNTSYPAGSSATFELPEETTNTQQLDVTVQAVSNDATFPIISSNTITIFNSANIRFPNAFVPEGVNSEFNVVGRYISTVSIKIYNRWGELVAHITDPSTGWDGTTNGRKAPGGTYIYAAEITDDTNNHYVRSGSVLLIRD